MDGIVLLVGVIVALWMRSRQLSYVREEAHSIVSSLQEVMRRVETVTESVIRERRARPAGPDPALKRIAHSLDLYVGAMIHKENPFPESTFGADGKGVAFQDGETDIELNERVKQHQCPCCRRAERKAHKFQRKYGAEPSADDE
jgi:hypothetical protein